MDWRVVGLFIMGFLFLTPISLGVECDYYITSLPYDITDAGKTYCLNQSLTTTSYGIKYVNNTFNETYLYCFGNKIIGSGSNVGIIYGTLLETGKYLKSYDCVIENFTKGVSSVSSSTLWIENFMIKDVDIGVYLYEGANNERIKNSKINARSYGVYIYSPETTTIFGTTVEDCEINASIGIYEYFSSNTFKNNKIYAEIGYKAGEVDGSNIYNNLFNVSSKYVEISSLRGAIPKFNTTRTKATNIVGGTYIGGNYWGFWNGSGYSDTCTDGDNDGICDDPLLLTTVDTTDLYDYLPLTTYIPPTPKRLSQTNPLFSLFVGLMVPVMYVKWLKEKIEEISPSRILEALIIVVTIIVVTILLGVFFSVV